jgi:hypothetical protein
VSEPDQWRRCSACKKPIAPGAIYYVCSVSTCNRPRTGLVFCDVSCWEVHLPTARHRKAWAEEMTAPKTPTPQPTAASHAKPTSASTAASRPPKKSIARPASASRASSAESAPPREVLIIGSRLKDYVRARAGMNTSDRVLEPLSEIVRSVCDEAIRKAARDGRQTVLDRDIPRRR